MSEFDETWTPQNATERAAADETPITCLPLHKLLRLKEDPEPVPLQVYRPMKPYPIETDPFDFDADIQWSTLFPRWDFRFLFTMVTVFSYGLTLLLYLLPTLAFGKVNIRACYAFAITFTGVSFVFTAMRVNIARNQSLRATICKAMAKAADAKKIYDSGVVPAYLIKDKYCELKAFLGPTFVVFRDGTVEDNSDEHAIEQQHEMQNRIGNRAGAVAASQKPKGSPV